MSELLHRFLSMPWLELTGLVSGLLCVWLLIRQNIWTFPIGLLYSVVSVAVFTHERLYADVLLNAYYVLMNGYGWYYWLYGGRRPRPEFRPESRPGNRPDTLPVTFSPRRVRWVLLALVAAGTLAMGWFLDNRTNADLPYWDSATTTMSFAAMWMTARKYIDNWIVWLVVDVIATGMYIYKGIEFYAVLYGIYLIMAVMGWRAWKRGMDLVSSSA